MLRKLAMVVWAAVIGGCLCGCMSQGHRKVTIEFFGQTIVVEDETYLNEEGKSEYSATFDDKNNVVAWLLGWLKPEAEAEANAVEDDG